MRSRSSSSSSASSSSASSSSQPADMLQIFVKIGGGKSIPLNVRPSNSLSDVLDFLSASTNLPSDVRILLAGRHLQRSETIKSLNLPPASTLDILAPLSGGTSPADMAEASSATAPPPAQPTSQSDGSPLEPTNPNHLSTESATLNADATPTSASAAIAAMINPESAPQSTLTPPPSSRSTTSTPARRKPRCAHPPCKAPAQPITGDCGFCQLRFCSKHRMLESHACEGLEDAKKAERDRNRQKLENERTVMVRGI